jgi:hypothetical protein
MKVLASLAAALMAAAAALAQDSSGANAVEEAFVACLVEQDIELARTLMDAPSQEAFEEALEEGLNICPVPVDQMSLGRFYTALDDAFNALEAADEEAE